MEVAQHMATDDPSWHDLITAASRAAFQIEAAELRGDAREEVRQRVIYHTAQAELLARTLAYDRAAQAQIAKNQQDHRCKAEAYQRELDRLTETKGGERDV
ncbi:hypothetical protein M8009_00590 [Halomonas sp. ATCH28]|uniref:Uncharacterized protein n=1 Tax=Halomonas gemina TaxID=2945105 RepID=A0ABT0SVW3_9GAMM|nr:hypothetical protein [Halomonas gemina]MCL7938800.1 hypothetical protein [Halomonas gemina]